MQSREKSYSQGRGAVPRIMTQTPSPSKKGNVEASLWPPLRRSQGFTHLGEETGKAGPGRVPSTPLSPPLHWHTSLGLASPSWPPGCPLPEPAHVPTPPHSPAGPDPPMAMSRLLGGVHVSVIIFPVTATTCGAPSGGPGTTSESHRSEVCWVFQGPLAVQDPQASGQWVGAGGTATGPRARPDAPQGTRGREAPVGAEAS